LHDALFLKPARILTAKVTVGQSDLFEALIDGGSQLNLVSAELAKEHDLPITPLSKILAKGVDGRKLKVYGTTETSVRIVDSRGKEHTQDVPFLVTDAPKYQMYLGLPWIDACQPKISYATRRMLFRGTKAKDRPVYRKIALDLMTSCGCCGGHGLDGFALCGARGEDLRVAVGHSSCDSSGLIERVWVVVGDSGLFGGGLHIAIGVDIEVWSQKRERRCCAVYNVNGGWRQCA
jgi:hypothetical protein